MVSADDEIRTADRNENVDLFWAVRGGGDNYVNLQLAEDDSDRTAGAYRSHFERLRRIKAEYHPYNHVRLKSQHSSLM